MDTRDEIIRVFNELGKEMKLVLEKDVEFEIFSEHDVHGFYRLNNERVIHVQGYPGMSNEEKMYVSARLRDYQKMIEETRAGKVSRGNEHSSNIPGKLNHMQLGKFIQYNATLLAKELEEVLE